MVNNNNIYNWLCLWRDIEAPSEAKKDLQRFLDRTYANCYSSKKNPNKYIWNKYMN